jgi:hypothetical protein
MQEENEERQRYLTKLFSELPVWFRQSITRYLREETLTRRGDAAFEVDTENVSFQFAVRNTAPPGSAGENPRRTHADFGPRPPRSHQDPLAMCAPPGGESRAPTPNGELDD